MKLPHSNFFVFVAFWNIFDCLKNRLALFAIYSIQESRYDIFCLYLSTFIGKLFICACFVNLIYHKAIIDFRHYKFYLIGGYAYVIQATLVAAIFFIQIYITRNDFSSKSGSLATTFSTVFIEIETVSAYQALMILDKFYERGGIIIDNKNNGGELSLI